VSIADAEASSYNSDPVLLFLFVMNTTRWGYVGQDVETYTYNGTDYMPDPYVSLGPVSQSLAERATDIEIEIGSKSEVARLFVPYMPPEPVFVRVFRHLPDGAPGEYNVEVIAEVVSSQFDETTGVCTLTARQISKDLDRKVPWCVYSTMCNYAVFGAGCQVDREAYVTVTNIVTGAGTDTLGSPDFATAGVGNGAPEEWFRGGSVIHVATREVRFIVAHDTNSPNIKLQTPFRDLKNGDEVRAYPGCSRLRTQCGPRYNNLDRMLAFPWHPSKNPYTQSVYGNQASSSESTDKKVARLKQGVSNSGN